MNRFDRDKFAGTLFVKLDRFYDVHAGPRSIAQGLDSNQRLIFQKYIINCQTRCRISETIDVYVLPLNYPVHDAR